MEVPKEARTGPVLGSAEMPHSQARAGPFPLGPLPILVASVLASLAGAGAVLIGQPKVAGGIAIVAGVALVVGAMLARATGGRRSLFAELVADRVFDGAFLAPLSRAAREVAPEVSVLALLVLGAAYVASYERARGSALGYRGSEPLEYRAARAALVAGALLLPWPEALLIAALVLTVSAAAVRTWNVVLQERRTDGARSP